MANEYYSEYFRYKSGYLWCEEAKVDDIRQNLKSSCFPSSPFFLYSRNQIRQNVRLYQETLRRQNFPSQLNFAVKANPNLAILKEMKMLGCSLTLVSGMELKLALSLNFEPSMLMLNGNGKADWEVEMAVKENVLLNIDGAYNLEQTIRICRDQKRTARVLLRVNTNTITNIHDYLMTGKISSKFGTDIEELDDILDMIKQASELTLAGLHCHIGSTIEDVTMYRKTVKLLVAKFEDLKTKGFSGMKYLNVGGGLGIPYTKHAPRTSKFLSINSNRLEEDSETNDQSDSECSGGKPQSVKSSKSDKVPASGHPSPADLVASFSDLIKDDMVVILEPGRSLVGNAAILVTSVYGCKKSGNKNYITIDGGMTDVIRPCLYGGYHHIDLIEPTRDLAGKRLYDVVGPVCECGDFLGKDRYLSTPHCGCGLAVFDVGAYCSSQASNYNFRLRPAEVMVDGKTWTLVRRPDSFDDLVRPYMM